MNRAEQLKAAGDGQPRQYRRVRAHRAATPAGLQPGGDPAVSGTSPPSAGAAPAGADRCAGTPAAPSLGDRLAGCSGGTCEVTDDELEDLTAAEREEVEEDVVDAATAARTVAELDTETRAAADLVELARRVRHSGTDKKWTELRGLLLRRRSAMYEPDGNLRKIIIFTEHRDTLDYLVDRDPRSARPRRGGGRHPRRRRAGGSPGSRRSCSPRTRTPWCWSPPTPPARASTCSAPT